MSNNDIVIVAEDKMNSDEDEETVLLMQQWTSHHLKFDGWFGYAAHQLQLVVNDGYNELKNYRRIQATFGNVKTVYSLSRHFAYAISKKFPVPCETRWNSYFKLS